VALATQTGITIPSPEHTSYPSLDPPVGEDMTDINMEYIERNSPVVIPPTQEQNQLQQQTPSKTNHSVAGGSQLTKNHLKAFLILNTPQPQ